MFLNNRVDLIHGECLSELSKIADDSIDLSFTSPPYNMNLRIRNGKHCSRQIVKEISTKYKNFDDNLSMDEYYKFNCDVIDQLLRVSRLSFYNVQFLTGNKSALFKLIGKYSDNIKEIIIWDKKNAQPAIQQLVLNSQYEVILVLSEKEDAISRKFTGCNFARGELSNLWTIKRGKKQHKDHGAVFPLELAELIVEKFTWPGQIILDPFMGTGTTGVACKKLNRSFIGIEIDEDYYGFAKTRIHDANT